ncbi:Uncharacterised protein [Niallia circulans]|nr:Uncharacterised protein [Niallia circulans]
MDKEYEKIFKCIVSVHQTLSVCSKCIDCCDPLEEQLYADLAKDAALMIKKLNNHLLMR